MFGGGFLLFRQTGGHPAAEGFLHHLEWKKVTMGYSRQQIKARLAALNVAPHTGHCGIVGDGYSAGALNWNMEEPHALPAPHMDPEEAPGRRVSCFLKGMLSAVRLPQHLQTFATYI